MNLNKLYSSTLVFNKLGFIIKPLSVLIFLLLSSKTYSSSRDCIDAFEQGEYPKAVSGFLKLRKLGGTIGVAYLDYIDSNKLVDIKEGDITRIEPLPEVFLSQSKDYLDASLTIMKFYGRGGLKKESLKKTVSRLQMLAKGGNNRAALLLIKMIEDQQHKATTLSYLKVPLKDESKFCNCLLCKSFGRYLNPTKKEVMFDDNRCETCRYRATLKFNPDALFDVDILHMSNNRSIIPSEFSKTFSLFFFFLTQKDDGTAAHCIFKITQEPIWLRLSLENGCMDAISSFPKLKSHHDDVARYSHYVSAENGDVESQHQYADMLKKGTGGVISLERARLYLERAMNNSHAQSMFKYALMLKNGEGGESDLVTARKLFTTLAEKDGPESQYHLGLMLKNAEGGPQDLNQAREYMGRSAKSGNTEAESEYAFLLQDKNSGPVNLEEAREFHGKASKKGNEKSAQEYAKMVRFGEGGLADPVLARECYLLLANKGLSLFKHEYARMLYNGEGGAKDLPKAREYFRVLANEGDDCAAHQYAQMLKEGEGGSVNLFEAQRYFLLGAEKGNACCQFYYAQMLLKGEGIKKKSHERAREYFLKASSQGHAEAAASLQELDRIELQKAKENHVPASKKDIELGEDKKDESKVDSETVTYTFPYIPINEDEGCSSSDSDQEDEKDQVRVPEGVFSERSLLWIEKARIRREEKRERKAHKCTKCIDHTFEKIVVDDEDEHDHCGDSHSSHHHCDADKKVWYVKDKNTINFVDAIFSRNGQKINSFTVSDACKAFNDLGCASGKSRAGKSKVQIIYRDDVKKVIHKYKFHNPHGHGDNCLYIALVPYTKRFLVSIGLTEYSSVEFQQ